MADDNLSPTNQTKDEKLAEMRQAMKNPAAFHKSHKITALQWVLIVVIIGLIVWLAYSW